jgi:predicted DCC family thiol-disulfide oxidoreductase YuxK
MTILYDHDCGFCRWMLALLLSWDRGGRLRVLALQDPEADVLLGGMDHETKMSSAHLVLDDGTVLSGGHGAETVASVLPAGAPLALISRVLGGDRADRAYHVVADRRTALGRFVRPGWKRWADGVIASRRRAVT